MRGHTQLHTRICSLCTRVYIQTNMLLMYKHMNLYVRLCTRANENAIYIVYFENRCKRGSTSANTFLNVEVHAIIVWFAE